MGECIREFDHVEFKPDDYVYVRRYEIKPNGDVEYTNTFYRTKIISLNGTYYETDTGFSFSENSIWHNVLPEKYVLQFVVND